LLKDEPFLSPEKIGTDRANTFLSAITTSVASGLLHPDPVHDVTKHPQQDIASDHLRVKKNMPKIGGFRSFNTACRTIASFEAVLGLRKGFGFSGKWTVNDQIHCQTDAGAVRPCPQGYKTGAAPCQIRHVNQQMSGNYYTNMLD